MKFGLCRVQIYHLQRFLKFCSQGCSFLTLLDQLSTDKLSVGTDNLSISNRQLLQPKFLDCNWFNRNNRQLLGNRVNEEQSTHYTI